jgi:hypothetical protein
VDVLELLGAKIISIHLVEEMFLQWRTTAVEGLEDRHRRDCHPVFHQIGDHFPHRRARKIQASDFAPCDALRRAHIELPARLPLTARRMIGVRRMARSEKTHWPEIVHLRTPTRPEPSATTVYQEFRIPSNMLNVAVKQKRLSDNPCRAVEFPVSVAKSTRKPHYMTASEQTKTNSQLRTFCGTSS